MARRYMPKQAICTKYFGPTNSRGSRIQAKCAARTISVPYDHALDSFDNHEKAAQTLADRLGWKGELVGGGVEGKAADYCFVFVND